MTDSEQICYQDYLKMYFYKELRVNKTSSGENETLEVCRIIAYGS